MAASDASGGFLRGHGVAFALVAIFAGVALAVAYAASDGAIFGINAGSAPAGGVPVNDSSAGGAAVISRDTFDVAESGPVQNASSAPAESSTLSEEQRRLLAMRDFPWDSVAGGHIASTQDSMDRFRQPVPAEPGVDSLALSDRVVVNVDRGREEIEDDDLDLAEIIDDVIDIEIPIDEDDGEQPEEQEQPPEDDEQEEPPQDEGQGSDSDGGNQTDDDSSGEGSEDEGSGDDGQSGEGSGGNSTSSDPSEDSGSDGGNSTGSEGG